MKARTAFMIAFVLGLLVLAPVAAVVGLGVYGSSLGGASTAKASTGASLTLAPASGLPGAAVTIQGRNWPPKARVSLFLTRPAIDGVGEATRMRLADLIASRSGGFEIESLLPSSVILRGMAQVFVEASGQSVDGQIITTSPAPFAVEPYPNRLIVNVADKESGQAVPDADVTVEDPFGQVLAAGRTGPSGTVDFQGVRPGRSSVGVKRLDHYRQTAALNMASSGDTKLQVEVARSAGRRLYLPAAHRAADGRIVLTGVDRTSGLKFEEAVSMPDARFAPVRDASRTLLFSYFLAEEGTSESGASKRIVDALWAIGRAGQRIASSNGYPSAVWHLASTDRAEIVYATEGIYADAYGTSLLLIDKQSGRVISRQPFSPSVLTPTISRDGRQAYLLNWVLREVQVVDLATGKTVKINRGLPRWVGYTITAPLGEGIYLLSAREGDIFHLDLSTGALSGPVLEVPGAMVMANMPEGRLAIATAPRASLIVADPVGGGIVGVAPLPEPADWLWVDPDGPYIFAGHYDGLEGFTVFVIDAQTLEAVERLKFDFQAG